MFRHYMKSKIHGAVVTGCNINYHGSISIDSKLMRLSNIHENEKVQVLNLLNGERIETYAIYGRGGEICLNGAAARKFCEDDKVIIISYCMIEEGDEFESVVIFPSAGNVQGKIEHKRVKNIGS